MFSVPDTRELNFPVSENGLPFSWTNPANNFLSRSRI